MVSTSPEAAPPLVRGQGSPTLRQLGAAVGGGEQHRGRRSAAPPAMWPKVASTTVRPLAASWAPAVWPPAGSATSLPVGAADRAPAAPRTRSPGRSAGACPATRSAVTVDDLQRVRRAARLLGPAPAAVGGQEQRVGAEGVADLRGGEPQAGDQVAAARAAVGLAEQRLRSRDARSRSGRRRWCGRSRCRAAARRARYPAPSRPGVLIQVRSTARKPAGTGPPIGPCPLGPLDPGAGCRTGRGAGTGARCRAAARWAPARRWSRSGGLVCAAGGWRSERDQRGADQDGRQQHRHHGGGGGRQHPAAASRDGRVRPLSGGRRGPLRPRR